MQVISTDGNVKTHTNMLKSDVNKGEVLEISLDGKYVLKQYNKNTSNS